MGTPVVVSDRTGVAASFADGEALVVPYETDATVDAVARVIRDRCSSCGGRPARGRPLDLGAAVDQQLAIYAEAIDS